MGSPANSSCAASPAAAAVSAAPAIRVRSRPTGIRVQARVIPPISATSASSTAMMRRRAAACAVGCCAIEHHHPRQRCRSGLTRQVPLRAPGERLGGNLVNLRGEGQCQNRVQPVPNSNAEHSNAAVAPAHMHDSHKVYYGIYLCRGKSKAWRETFGTGINFGRQTIDFRSDRKPHYWISSARYCCRRPGLQ
jgi:hypothetical protein